MEYVKLRLDQALLRLLDRGCPTDIGLEDTEGSCDNQCYECWKRALEPVIIKK